VTGECSACGATMRPGAKFCAECGVGVVSRACSACGAAGEGGKFCAECGTPFSAGAPVGRPVGASPVAERRVTSVLFGDLVGFTPLSESKDSEEVRELLSAYFDRCRIIVGRYGGMVEKFIGDAVMAVWGVPLAHEDDAERAVRAGLELAAAVAAMGAEVGAPGLAMRVGIVTGEVAVTVGATGEGMVAGDAVNTAARVQSAAEPGRVWVDDTTKSLAAAAITFDDRGEHPLKGKAAPVRLWAAGFVVAPVGGGSRVDGLEAPFTGRNGDLRLVKDLFHGTEESRRPRLVVLDGEAGVGKSRLAWEFEKYVDGLAATMRWHRGRCLAYGDGVAFWALAEALRTRFGLLEADAGEVVAERLDAGLVEFVADPSDRAWLRPRLAVLLGADGTASFTREDLFTAWTAFLEHLTHDDRTVVLVIDEAQHADDGMLDFLDHLLSTAQAPIFVLALARPELLARRPGLGARRTSVVHLDPLDAAAMADLVDGLVVGLPPVSRSALVARADGIPLYAVETVRALIDRDLVVPREGQYVPAAQGVELDLDAIGAPASLQALVAARLDTLSTAERRVVTDASVLGASFTLDGIIALGAAPDDVHELLGSLRRKEIITLQTDRFSAELGQYRFVQSVVRQVAYATQSRRDRTVRHLAAADHLAELPDPSDDLAVVIARHLLDALEAAPSEFTGGAALAARARSYLERAAARARRVGAPGDAQRLLEIALDSAEADHDRARVHLFAAEVAEDAGHRADARAHAQAALTLFELIQDPIGCGRAAAALSYSTLGLSTFGDNSAAVGIAEAGWQALEGVAGAERARFDLALALSRAHAGLGSTESELRWAERMVFLAEALDDLEALAKALEALGSTYLRGGAHRAGVILLEAAVVTAREHDYPLSLGRALGNLAAFLNSKDLAAALRHSEQARDVARRAGVQAMEEIARVNMAVGLWCSGRLTDAAAALPESLESADPQRDVAWPVLQAWVAEAQGMTIPPSPPVSDTATDTDGQSNLAWLRSADLARAVLTSDREEATHLAPLVLDHLLAASGLDDDFFVLWPPAVLAALGADDLDLAERLIAPVTDALPGQRPPAVTAQWHRLRGLLAAVRGDDPEFAETELRAGIDALATFGAVGFHAQAQEELGRWLVTQSRTDEAAPLLDAARTAYAEIGAAGWLARLDTWQTSLQR
jgi:class 3 adenylate cyclase/tetratricopeptide (TPR) repeat protein